MTQGWSKYLLAGFLCSTQANICKDVDLFHNSLIGFDHMFDTVYKLDSIIQSDENPIYFQYTDDHLTRMSSGNEYTDYYYLADRVLAVRNFNDSAINDSMFYFLNGKEMIDSITWKFDDSPFTTNIIRSDSEYIIKLNSLNSTTIDSAFYTEDERYFFGNFGTEQLYCQSNSKVCECMRDSSLSEFKILYFFSEGRLDSIVNKYDNEVVIYFWHGYQTPIMRYSRKPIGSMYTKGARFDAIGRRFRGSTSFYLFR
ncbi:hypothetical protein ACFL5V_03380 [Fibrobacterota bacterium]